MRRWLPAAALTLSVIIFLFTDSVSGQEGSNRAINRSRITLLEPETGALHELELYRKVHAVIIGIDRATRIYLQRSSLVMRSRMLKPWSSAYGRDLRSTRC
jgi:hypothetical protein